MYSCQTKLFEIELIICIKMDLALNNLQRLICHKIQPITYSYVLTYTHTYTYTDRHKHTHTHTYNEINIHPPPKKRRYLWCNGYRRRKWSQWHEFKSWTRLIAFHIALIPLGKVWIQLFSLQLWVNSRTD